jgi:NAD(P)-dependent dehydrogenase (short-subunit alcohol dehydrogenase family)
MADLSGKCVVITGASRGIGAAAARSFVAAGANVVLAARSARAIDALAAELGERALAVPCDVADWNSVAALMQRAQDKFGRIDVLVNNAGVIDPISQLAQSDPKAWGQVIDVNIKGVYHGLRAALPVMLAQGGGTILTIGSGAAHNALEGWSHYCTSKAAALMLNECMDKELSLKGIRAINLSPGTVATDMQVKIKASGINPVSQLDPSAHIPPEWVGQALVWLTTPAADQWTGREVSLRDENIRRAIGLIQ